VKYAVVSGASAGIGREISIQLANEGYTVFAGSRRLERLETLPKEVSGKGRVVPLMLDVTDVASVQHFCDEALKRSENQVSILVNNAGLALKTDHLVDGTENDWRIVLDTNVLGVLRLAKAFVKPMIKNRDGHVITMGSIAGYQSYVGGIVYSASKHAVRAIHDGLRLELLGTNIRCTSIEPGMVETEFSDVRFGDPARAKKVYENMTPLTGKDIADCVMFAVRAPKHVNIDHLVVMPTCQASVYHVHRDTP
jgi:NADP-dependent 3-hydroxy acid dehydrogenase YdfG